MFQGAKQLSEKSGAVLVLPLISTPVQSLYKVQDGLSAEIGQVLTWYRDLVLSRPGRVLNTSGQILSFLLQVGKILKHLSIARYDINSRRSTQEEIEILAQYV